MSLAGGPLQWPCMQLPMDGSHPRSHTCLGYHTPCIPHIHRLQLGTHRMFLLHRNKPPKVPRYLNRRHGNVHSDITKDYFFKWYYMFFLLILRPFYFVVSKASTRVHFVKPTSLSNLNLNLSYDMWYCPYCICTMIARQILIKSRRECSMMLTDTNNLVLLTNLNLSCTW